MPDTEHAAIAKLLAKWGAMAPRDRPLWLVNEIENLGAAFNAVAVAQANKGRATKSAREPDPRRAKIRKALLAGKTSDQIRASVGCSQGLVQLVRDELRAAGLWPVK